nr:unnamed protein product [Callosobruchus analis]
MPFSFNRAHITMLIEEYKKYPELYDRLHERYNDNSRRYDCWLEITQKLMSTFDISPTINDVKHKMTMLRTQLANEVGKERKMKITNRHYRSPWYYYRMMYFLVDGGFIQMKRNEHDQTMKLSESASEATIESSSTSFKNDNSSLSFYDLLKGDYKPEIHTSTDVHNLMDDSSIRASYKDSRYQFNHEQVEIIIELYKNYPELYNPRDPHYHSRKRKLDIWQGITQRISTLFNISPTIEDVKNKIRSLRTQYAYELKRESTNNGRGPNGPPFKSNWWCYDLFSFLNQLNSKQVRKMSHSELSSTIPEQNGTMDDTGSNDVVSAESPLAEDIIDIRDVDFSCTPSVRESSDELDSDDNQSRDPICTKKPQKTDTPDDDLSVFAQYIEAELRKIKDKKKLTQLKRNIINLIYDTIDEDEN